MSCECFQVAKIECVNATFVPLADLAKIAKQRFPNDQINAIFAMQEALQIARARIERNVVAA